MPTSGPDDGYGLGELVYAYGEGGGGEVLPLLSSPTAPPEAAADADADPLPLPVPLPLPASLLVPEEPLLSSVVDSACCAAAEPAEP